MRRFILILFAFLSFTMVKAQSNSLITNIGASFTGTGDMWGTMITVGFEHGFTDRLNLALFYDQQDFSAIYSSDNYVTGEVGVYRTLNMALGYKLFNISSVGFYLYAGGYARSVNDIWGSNNYSTMQRSFDPYKVFSIGYIVMPTFNIALSDKVQLFTRLSLQNDTHADITSSAGIGLKMLF